MTGSPAPLAQRAALVTGASSRINHAAWSAAARRRALENVIPYGRIGEAEDVAQAVVWLASDASDYVTGTTLVDDAGKMFYPAFEHGG